MTTVYDIGVELEGIVDSLGLNRTLEALVEICGEKADHLRSNWQDGQAARRWEKAGDVIARIVDHKSITALD